MNGKPDVRKAILEAAVRNLVDAADAHEGGDDKRYLRNLSAAQANLRALAPPVVIHNTVQSSADRFCRRNGRNFTCWLAALGFSLGLLLFCWLIHERGFRRNHADGVDQPQDVQKDADSPTGAPSPMGR